MPVTLKAGDLCQAYVSDLKRGRSSSVRSLGVRTRMKELVSESTATAEGAMDVPDCEPDHSA